MTLEAQRNDTPETIPAAQRMKSFGNLAREAADINIPDGDPSELLTRLMATTRRMYNLPKVLKHSEDDERTEGEKTGGLGYQKLTRGSEHELGSGEGSNAA